MRYHPQSNKFPLNMKEMVQVRPPKPRKKVFPYFWPTREEVSDGKNVGYFHWEIVNWTNDERERKEEAALNLGSDG